MSADDSSPPDSTAADSGPAGAFAASPEDLRSVREWFATFGRHVATVDFAAARPMFAEDALAFGTHSDVLIGRDAIELEQWRRVWPTIDNFRFNLESLCVDVSGDGTRACAVVPWTSQGITPEGTRFGRPGRATLLLVRTAPDAPWRAAHSHFSLNRGIPQQSHGKRPAAGP